MAKARERAKTAMAKPKHVKLVGEDESMGFLWHAEEFLMEALYNQTSSFEDRRVAAFRTLRLLEKFRAHESLYRRPPEEYDGEG